jgi:S-adenosylmethionine synthetase
MTLEAAAGKNPVNHVGKLYNVAAHRIAEAIVAALPAAVAEAHCYLVSRIGHPIHDPAVVHMRVRTRDGADPRDLEAEISRIAEAYIAGLAGLADRFVAGEIAIF